MNPRRKLLILYDYFDPAYKAGGPIRSLVNLVKLLETEFELFVLTGNQDHDGTPLNVISDQWMQYGSTVQVKYLSREQRGFSVIKKVLKEVQPTVIYLNGIYSLPFVVYPLAILRNQKEIKIVIAPRGMMQTQALSIKPWKKKVYLAVLKYFFIHQNIHWHITTEQEKSELLNFVDSPERISHIGNVSNFHQEVPLASKKINKTIVFGTVALISPMKNVHLVLEALSKISYELIYKLYGPIKDEAYWNYCLKLVNKLPANIQFRYLGEISPEKVGAKIHNFNFYIQPSKSENFGHSIYEAFNQGIPVIISDQTPWKSLKEMMAGWDVDLKSPESLKKAIEEAINMDPATYVEYRSGARRLAEKYVADHDFVKDYRRLFS